MYVRFPSSRSTGWRNIAVWILAFLWAFGFVLGACISAGSFGNASMMRIAAQSNVSIAGSCVVVLLPLLLSVASVYFDMPFLILPLGLIKSFSFGYISTYTLHVFGDAAWLVRCLFLFSDIVMNMFMLWFWFRHIPGRKEKLFKDTFICLIAACIVAAADHLVASPFLMMLMEKQ